MSGVDANHSHDSLAPYHLALVTNLLNRCSNLHLLTLSLFLTVGNPSPGQVVWRQLNLYLIPG